jgi:hypothetical protein
MAIIRKSIKEQQIQQRRKRRQAGEQEKPSLFEGSFFSFAGVMLVFVVFAILICFVGVSPAGPAIVKGQIARSRVVAEIPFDYISDIETQAAAENLKQRIPPVYRLDKKQYEAFRTYIINLNEKLNDFLKIPGIDENSPEVARKDLMQTTADEISSFLMTFDPLDSYSIDPSDLAILANNLNSEERSNIFTEALHILGDIYSEGIYDPEQSSVENEGGSLSFFNIQQESGHIRKVEIQRLEDALRSLRINLSVLEAKRNISTAVYRIIRNGIKPNLEYDDARTKQLENKALASLEKKVIKVSEGTTIVEPNQRVDGRIYEMYAAYLKKLSATPEDQLKGSEQLAEQTFLTLVVGIAAMLYIRIRNPKMITHPRLIFLQGMVILANLLIIRLILGINGSGGFQNSSSIVAILPWFAPVALAPIVCTVILGSSSGILASCLLSILYALMQGQSIVTMLASFLCGITAVYLCSNVQLRARLVRAGFFSGLTYAICAFFLGIRDTLSYTLVLEQMLIAASVGLVTGIIVVGLLPIMENIFKYTTDITLLELTDYNHPLLRQMQVTAPGSYHHSLMVANMSENAAVSIGANALICRVCALYHDIGKMVKPEYFTENQRDGFNPHIERNPSMSALIIKAHVKEGSIMAKQNKLPQIIIDVIKEHHGTSLIQYFYYKALEQQNSQNTAPIGNENLRIDLDEVNESTYRYEGPIPHFKESAIIMLADSLEAASRSLKKVTPQSIEELIDRIIQARINDGQLNNVSLTLKEIALIKESFSFTILNMLHSRVEYPTQESIQKKKSKPPIPTQPKQPVSKPTEDSNTPEKQETNKRNIKNA